MKTIAVDLDGTTWKIHELLLSIYNKKYNENTKIEDYNKWNYLPEDRFKEIYLEMVKKIDHYKPMTPFIGKYINLLYKFYDISFLTHGWYEKEQIEQKLNSWGIFKGKSYTDIIIEDINISKINHDFDYYIDDNPNMVIDIQKYPKTKVLLLFTQPWNKHINVCKYENICRVHTWREIMTYFVNPTLVVH